MQKASEGKSAKKGKGKAASANTTPTSSRDTSLISVSSQNSGMERKKVKSELKKVKASLGYMWALSGHLFIADFYKNRIFTYSSIAETVEEWPEGKATTFVPARHGTAESTDGKLKQW